MYLLRKFAFQLALMVVGLVLAPLIEKASKRPIHESMKNFSFL